MELEQLVREFAASMMAADRLAPQAVSHRREGVAYRPGIGPFAEDEAVRLTVDQMRLLRPGVYDQLAKVRYPNDRRTCDLGVGDPPTWAIEVKLARVGRDNGTYEDTAVKKILSPYPDDRSAVTDCVKLARSEFGCRKGVLIYGFEDEMRPLDWLIDAFELIAAKHVELGPRVSAPLDGLVHPIFNSGAVFAWEVYGLVNEPASNRIDQVG
jgi:hypothetical protein